MARPLSRDIEDLVLDWRRVAWPLDPEAVFGRRAPLVLEIGFGNGEFLADLAAARPDRDHLGIELSWSGAIRLFPRLRKRGATNARALLGDAAVLVERLFDLDVLDEVYVNHPCPWPKARHHGRRLLTAPFLELLASRMRPGARLTMVTDHAEYAEWLHEELGRQRALESRHATAEVASIPGRKPTKYQQKAMDQGVPIHFFEWRRPDPPTLAGPAAPPVSDPSESPMLSLTLEGAVDLDRSLSDFRTRAEKGTPQGVTTVVKLDAAWRGTDGTWLVSAMTQEDGLRQDFALLAVPREGGVLVKLGELGRAHPTRAVKRAVELLGTHLAGEGVRITHRNLGETTVEEGAC